MSPEQITELLKELLERVEHPLEMMRPMEVSLKDPTPSESRRRIIGIVRRSGFDIDTDVYNWLQNVIPEKAVLKGILWLEEEAEPTDQVGSISSKIKTKAEKEVFPVGQYFSPFDLGAKRKEPVTEEDTTKDFLRENQLP